MVDRSQCVKLVQDGAISTLPLPPPMPCIGGPPRKCRFDRPLCAESERIDSPKPRPRRGVKHRHNRALTTEKPARRRREPKKSQPDPQPSDLAPSSAARRKSDPYSIEWSLDSCFSLP